MTEWKSTSSRPGVRADRSESKNGVIIWDYNKRVWWLHPKTGIRRGPFLTLATAQIIADGEEV